MALMQIRIYPDEALRRIAQPLDVVDDEVRRMLDDMAETMYANEGIGLAAPQVGLSKRLVVLDVPGDKGGPGSGLLYLVNPEIVEREGTTVTTEGCLSFPGLEVDVKRSARVRLAYLDQHGSSMVLDASGLLAVCIQHEVDHLDGVVFLDRLGPVSRRLALRSFDKLRARAAADAGSAR